MRKEAGMIADFSLEGKVAIVTGAAAGGIGETYSQALAEAGAAVVCADINHEGAAAVADAIAAAGGLSIAVAVDITDDAAVQAMADTAVSEFGGVDILVNNAASMVEVSIGGGMMGFSSDLWDKAFAINVKGSWNCARAVVPAMEERGGGRIINQSSVGAMPAESVYGITKLAVIGLTTSLARELGPKNINVNCIAPGAVRSVAGDMLTPDDSPFVQAMASRAALRFRGERSELCGALLLFASSAGSWITGQVLVVDGGCVTHV